MSTLSSIDKPKFRLSQKHLDVNDPDLKIILSDMQGNILKSHGRSHSRHLFLKFKGNPKNNRIWLNRLSQQLTSAYEQHQTALEFKHYKTEYLFTGILISATGYKALGIDDRKIPDDKAFRAGMKDIYFLYDTGSNGVHKRTSNPLNDSPNSWQNPFNKQIDILIILAYGGPNTDPSLCNRYLDNEIIKIQNELKNTASILAIEEGYTLRNENNDVIEHFGFVDGLSNPVFFKSDFDYWQNREGTEYYDPSAPFQLVGVNDEGGCHKELSFGSYFVYRKIQQNIKGFKSQAKLLATEISKKSGSNVSAEYAEVLAFGRHKNGSSLIQKAENNFSFTEDTKGLKCPFHSHIRKTNPRGDTTRLRNTPLQNERSRRIVRRGISYGSKNLNPDKEWTDAGLLFLSCQSDIEQQFLVTQCGWSDNYNFPSVGTGHDPITGDQNTKPNINNQWQHEIDGKIIDLDFRYKNLVKILGGEYFFAPSISFFRNIIEK